MKSILIIAFGFAVAALAAVSLTSLAHAGSHDNIPLLSAEPVTQAGLAWRCGKNNPAMWGTFGNGCLKQKRAAKNTSAVVIPHNPATMVLGN